MADKKITELELATPEETDVIPFVDISDTTMGLSGTTKKATKADLKGEKGDNATADAGTTTTGNAGTNASVVNSGTTQNAVFDFTIPRGDKGETGDAGACVESVAFVGDDIVFTLDDASTVTLVGAKTSLKGDTGAQVESVAFVGDDMVFTLDDASTATIVGAKTDLKGDTGEAGDDAYVYIAYASADDGTDFTTTFNPLLNYIAIKTTTTPIASPQASDFTGLWKNYKGEKGDTGDIGIDWQGAWSAGTYTITQAVSHNGSSWICTATSTTEEPSISATDWDLMAQKGTDGTGSGDVIGPASATDKGVALFDTTTGKLLKNSTSFVQLYNGNVGIGTTTPSAKLEVVGNDTYAPIKISRASNNKQIGVSYYPAGTLSNSNKAWIMGVEENSNDFSFYNYNGSTINNILYLTNTNNVGIGTTSPTAVLHLKEGTATSGTAPLKFTSGVVNTTPEAGAIEFDGTDLFITI